MSINKKIGQNLKKVRESIGIKQETLAKHLRCSKPAISMMESGQIDFSVGRIEKIAAFLEVDFFSIMPSQSQVLNVNGNQNSGSFYGTHNHNISPDLIAAIVDEISKRMMQNFKKNI